MHCHLVMVLIVHNDQHLHLLIVVVLYTLCSIMRVIMHPSNERVDKVQQEIHCKRKGVTSRMDTRATPLAKSVATASPDDVR
jgi:hypothetical protein